MRVKLAAALIIAGGSIACAQTTSVITVCGAAKGKSVFLQGTSSLDWVDDGVSGGGLTFVRKRGEYDISIRGAGNNRFTAREDGATITEAPGGSDHVITLIASYPLGTTEVYQLTLDQSGAGTLIWLAAKNGRAGTTRGSVFTATCRRPS